MGPKDLHSFISMLGNSGDLSRIKCQVDPNLEIAAIVDRVCKNDEGGKALLFENVQGSNLRIAANLFGSRQRMATCFGVPDIEEFGSCYCNLYVSKEWNDGLVPHDYIPERRPPEKMTF